MVRQFRRVMKIRLFGVIASLLVLIPAQPVFASSESAINGEPAVHNQAIVRIEAEVENPQSTIENLG